MLSSFYSKNIEKRVLTYTPQKPARISLPKKILHKILNSKQSQNHEPKTQKILTTSSWLLQRDLNYVDINFRANISKISETTFCNIVVHSMLHTSGQPLAICCKMLDAVGWISKLDKRLQYVVRNNFAIHVVLKCYVTVRLAGPESEKNHLHWWGCFLLHLQATHSSFGFNRNALKRVLRK